MNEKVEHCKNAQAWELVKGLYICEKCGSAFRLNELKSENDEL